MKAEVLFLYGTVDRREGRVEGRGHPPALCPSEKRGGVAV